MTENTFLDINVNVVENLNWENEPIYTDMLTALMEVPDDIDVHNVPSFPTSPDCRTFAEQFSDLKDLVEDLGDQVSAYKKYASNLTTENERLYGENEFLNEEIKRLRMAHFDEMVRLRPSVETPVNKRSRSDP